MVTNSFLHSNVNISVIMIKKINKTSTSKQQNTLELNTDLEIRSPDEMKVLRKFSIAVHKTGYQKSNCHHWTCVKNR